MINLKVHHTRRCRICIDKDAELISKMLECGAALKHIHLAFPELGLTDSDISRHRKHYIILNQQPNHELTDTEFVEDLRQLGHQYVTAALDGKHLGMVEQRVIQTALNGILGRKNIDDVDQRQKAMNDLIANATKQKDGEPIRV